MKNLKEIKSQLTRQALDLVFWIVWMFLTEVSQLNAADTYTNCNWLSFGLSIPQTNVMFGNKIMANMVCSNTSEVVHWLRPVHGDPCGPGFGEYWITEMISGKKVECIYSPERRLPYSSSLDIIEGHTVKSYGNNLAYGYAITNAGVYIVQASGRFSSNEPPLLPVTFTVVTPPILIWVSPNTNVLPK
jgi:hypothetical protein